MTDTNGPGGPTMIAQLVRGDHLCRGTIYLVTGVNLPVPVILGRMCTLPVPGSTS